MAHGGAGWRQAVALQWLFFFFSSAAPCFFFLWLFAWPKGLWLL
jgi:hypothetical protein